MTLFFEPWIGAHYEPFDLAGFTDHPPGLYPMHIIGESHYGDPHERKPGFTRDVIARRALVPSVGPFFPNIMKAVTGRPLNEIDRAEMWSWLAFSNYIQEFMTGPRVAPDKRQWDEGHLAFHELLATYRPDCLLVLGQRLWNKMTKADSFVLASLEHEGVTLADARVYEYEADEARRWTLAAHILHPSAPAFRLDKARKRLFLMRQWIDRIDTCGAGESFEQQRARIAA